MRQHRLFFIQLAILAVLASCNSSKTASTTTSGVSNPDAPYLWSGANPFPKDLKLSTDFDGIEEGKISTMGDSWTAALNGQRDFFNYTLGAPEVADGNFNVDSLA